MPGFKLFSSNKQQEPKEGTSQAAAFGDSSLIPQLSTEQKRKMIFAMVVVLNVVGAGASAKSLYDENKGADRLNAEPNTLSSLQLDPEITVDFLTHALSLMLLTRSLQAHLSATEMKSKFTFCLYAGMNLFRVFNILNAFSSYGRGDEVEHSIPFWAECVDISFHLSNVAFADSFLRPELN